MPVPHRHGARRPAWQARGRPGGIGRPRSPQAEVVSDDAAGGLSPTADQATNHRRLCTRRLAAATGSVAMVPQGVHEAQVAWRTLREPGG